MVRGKIEKAYAERIKYMYTAEGKTLENKQNIDALKQYQYSFTIEKRRRFSVKH